MDSSSLGGEISVYLACSPRDQAYLERLRIHLGPMKAGGLIQVWEEDSILPGAQHLVERERIIAGASVAILLVSADFLASSDIVKHVLPLILEKARLNIMTILPIIISHCAFQHSSLAPYKPVNNLDRPVEIMRWGEKEMVWQRVVQVIRAIQQEDQKKNNVVDQPVRYQPKEVNVVPTHHSRDTEPVLDESCLEPLSNALLSAFPTRTDLKMFISYALHQNIEVIAAGNNLEEQTYSLVMWAYSRGQMNALIAGALERNPGNPKLRKFAAEQGF